MRLGKWLFAFLIIAFTPLLFTVTQTFAAELTDTEIGQFRKLMEERQAEAKPIPGQLTNDETASLRGVLEQFKDIGFGGFVENFWQYEIQARPSAGDSNAIPPKVFDRQVNSFTVNNIEMWLMKEATDPGDIGFKITLNWGDTARRITFVGPVTDDGATQPNPPGFPTGGRQATFSEAFVLYNIPIGKGLTAKFGKFATWVGYEVWEAQWNPNFSRSYIYGWLIPFTNTGVGLSYPVLDNLTVDYYFVNTSDGFVNNNKSYTHGLQIDYNPADLAFFKDTNIHLDTLWGPEGDGPGANSQWIQRYDLTVSFAPFDKWSLATNANVSLLDQQDHHDDISAWGIAQYVVYQHSDRIGGALRAEYFWDGDNMAGLSGVEVGNNPSDAIGAKMGEITATLNLKIKEKLYLRPELRYDKILGTRKGNVSHVWGGGPDLENKNLTGSIAATYEF